MRGSWDRHESGPGKPWLEEQEEQALLYLALLHLNELDCRLECELLWRGQLYGIVFLNRPYIGELLLAAHVDGQIT